MTTDVPLPEFSRPTPVEALDSAGRSFAIEANADERSAVARRLGLVSLDLLSTNGRASTRAGGRNIRVEARLRAEVVQECVVTLGPVPASIDVEFVRDYLLMSAEPPDGKAATGEVTLAGDEIDVDPLTGDTIDLGRATVPGTGPISSCAGRRLG